MKIDRLLAMTILLLNRRRISAAELAERFEVSTKTVYRDIETLCRAGIPIVSHQGMNGGFELMERYTIGRQMLSPGEIEALRTAVKGAATAMGDRTFDELTEKVQALLGGNGTGGEAAGPGVVFDFNPWNCGPSMRHRIELLRSAAKESLRVEVRYLNMNGGESRRTLEPAMLLLKGGTWYLQAYCLLRGEFRIFRLTRMLELRETGEPFLPKPAPPIESYDWKDDWDRRTPLDVSLHFRPAVRLRVIDQFEPSRLTESADGSVRVGGLFVADEWFYGMLLSYGDQVRVESPREVAEELLRRARQIVEAYAERAQASAGAAGFE
ncbi:DNA-binding transcriptional regulator [Saccharibacillus sp. O23]|uniref:helix-turn-helix transcriptional regulator n=1 Tax=Saccharibacillus sp. O23 TaxID=2009338 RepID=UPI000B4E3A44|nr:YafY family protein [Saccharibacillus sp. O23]OWR31871.1 DNA-binding transcriptional regulator [Saccharibacillus sp. O23]